MNRPGAAVFVVDAFTQRPLAGNPAAVVLLDGRTDSAWMQAVAAEMNLSETAFCAPDGDIWDLRWFTPVAEVDLCGHATLASAHVLWEQGAVRAGAPVAFDTASGRLVATPDGARITMDFPAEPPVEGEAPPELLAALGVDPVATARNRLDWLVQVASEAEVTAARPQLDQLAGVDARGAIITAAAEQPGADFVSRFFAPAVGVPEDPVTGSAHCALGPWWAQRLGRAALVGRQLSPRGGIVTVRVDGDRVHLGGHAVTVVAGRLLV